MYLISPGVTHSCDLMQIPSLWIIYYTIISAIISIISTILSTSVLIAPFMVKHMTDIADMISERFFGIIQDKIIELGLFEFVTTKETENPTTDL